MRKFLFVLGILVYFGNNERMYFPDGYTYRTSKDGIIVWAKDENEACAVFFHVNRVLIISDRKFNNQLDKDDILVFNQ